MVNQNRIRKLKEDINKKGTVVYWMSRDQRVNDNWALIYAQEMSIKRKVPLMVVFCLLPDFLNATIRQYGFMLRGLQEVEQKLNTKNIPFYLLFGHPEIKIPDFIKEHDAGLLITDFDPLKIKRKWKQEIAESIDIPFYEVDTHNIVPCWIASDKREYGAYTIRPKINRLLKSFLEEFPELKIQNTEIKSKKTEWINAISALKVDTSVREIDWIQPDEQNARKTIREFIDEKLQKYAQDSNNPTKDALSNLSPYLHFGQIASQRVALEIIRANVNQEAKNAFLEQLIIRKELSDNFCFYNDNYDSFDGFSEWAKRTLDEHRNDERDYVYTLRQFELAETHDELWNAAQKQMVIAGKMHGYMRMYWAKKILEWTKSPEQAMEIAIYLNDKYELDGRDPNGYTGIAWSIGGIHDRAWRERHIFGKIRYMSYNGAKSKFDIDGYIADINRITL